MTRKSLARRQGRISEAKLHELLARDAKITHMVFQPRPIAVAVRRAVRSKR